MTDAKKIDNANKDPKAADADAGADKNGNAADADGGNDKDNAAGRNKAAAVGDSQPEIYKPEGIPDHLLGANNNETIEKLLKGYAGARAELAKKKGIPEKIEDYNIELSEDQQKQWVRPGEDGKDPVFEALKSGFHAEGVAPDAAARLVSKIYEEAEKLGGQMEENLQDSADFDFKEMGGLEKAQPTIDANKAWITGLKTQGVIDDQDEKELLLLTTHGEGLRVLDKIRVKTGEKPIPANLEGKGGDDELTESKLNEMVKDERYWKTKDPEFIKKVTEGFQKIYGNEKVA